jgi:hypothetical protein
MDRLVDEIDMKCDVTERKNRGRKIFLIASAKKSELLPRRLESLYMRKEKFRRLQREGEYLREASIEARGLLRKPHSSRS